jgi:hypothetical protein
LFDRYTQEGTTWHAQTTVYSQKLEIIRSYKFTRKFSTNPDVTTVYHCNTYYSQDGEITQEQSWEIEKEKCDRADGVVHPAAEKMRAIGFGNDTSIWVSKNFSPEDNFGSEVFIRQADYRYGLIPVYQEGNLERLVIIKENPEKFPDRIESEKLEALAGNWQTKQIKVTSDLQEENEEFVAESLDPYFFLEVNETYYLPEQVIFNLPNKITLGRAFAIAITKQLSNNLYKQIKTEYDASGELKRIIASEFEKIEK